MPRLTQKAADDAEQIIGRFNQDVKAIKDDRDLTPEAKVRRLGAAYLQAKSAVDRVQADWLAEAEATVSTVDRDVFGSFGASGADAISFRDAADRASRLETVGDATRLLAQAERTGDDVLAQAIAQHAHSLRGNDVFGGTGWSSVVDVYAASRPDVAEKLQALDDARADDIKGSLQAAFAFGVPKPAELGQLSETSIAAMVEQVSA